eukprot:UN00835
MLVKLEDSEDVLTPTLSKPQVKKEQNVSSVSRGIDFQDVHTVINFDLPTTLNSYTHRIGRTARGGKTGVAVTYLVYNPAQAAKHTANNDAYVDETQLFEQMNLQRSITEGKNIVGASEQKVQTLFVDENLKANLKVRVMDCLSRIGPKMIKEARLKAVKQELLNNERLQQHWEQHPDEMLLLKHDKTFVGGQKISEVAQAIRTKKRINQNKYLPDYLQSQGAGVDLPEALRQQKLKRRLERAKSYAKKARQQEEKKEHDPLRQDENKKKKQIKLMHLMVKHLVVKQSLIIKRLIKKRKKEQKKMVNILVRRIIKDNVVIKINKKHTNITI